MFNIKYFCTQMFGFIKTPILNQWQSKHINNENINKKWLKQWVKKVETQKVYNQWLLSGAIISKCFEIVIRTTTNSLKQNNNVDCFSIFLSNLL